MWMQSNNAQAPILADPEWLALRYDETRDAIHFVHAPRQMHREAVFLTDEYLPSAKTPQIVPRSAIGQPDGPTAPVHFIFHSGFCCSTMLTRAFDQPGVAMGLKEPQILLDTSGFDTRSDSTELVNDVTDTVLSLLARPFDPGEAMIIKPSCVVNSQAQRSLELRPEANAVYLYAPLRVFLGSIVRKGITGRLWGRELFSVLRKAGLTELGYSDDELFGQSDLQIAGLAWLAQHIHFRKLADTFGKDRLVTLDSESFLAHPDTAIARLGTHFALVLTADQVTEITSGPAFTEHSKFGTGFDASDRDKDRTEKEDLYADEIAKVAIWIETVAQGLNESLELPHPLLD